MNGFMVLADAYRKMGQDRMAELMTFLAGCSQDDIYSLFDSSAFNEITRSYVRKAVRELVSEDVLEEEQAQAVRNRVNLLFSEHTAKEIAYEW